VCWGVEDVHTVSQEGMFRSEIEHPVRELWRKGGGGKGPVT